MPKNAVMDRLIAERAERVAFIEHTLEAVDSEDRDLSDTEQASLTSVRTRIAELDAQITPLREFAELRDAGEEFTRTTERTPARRGGKAAETWGEVVCRELVANYPGRGTSSRHEHTVAGALTRAPITTTQFPQDPVNVPGLELTYRTPLLDLLGTVTVSGGSVEYVTSGGAAPQAPVVAEGAPKPEATITYTTETATLVTLAHHVVVTRQALEDWSQLRGLIDSELRAGVLDKMEADAATCLAGTTVPKITGESLLEAIRVGIGNVGAAGGRPNAVVLNPIDYASLDVALMSLGGATSAIFGTTPWGMRYVPAMAIPAGTAYVLDSRAVRVYQRSSVQTYITDSGYLGGKDLFTANLFAILAEIRQIAVRIRDEFIVPVGTPALP